MTTFTMHLYDNAFGDDPPEDLAKILVDYGHGVGFTREMITEPLRNKAGDIIGRVDYTNPYLQGRQQDETGVALRCTCGEQVTVYHLDWTALACPACGDGIPRNEWRLTS